MKLKEETYILSLCDYDVEMSFKTYGEDGQETIESLAEILEESLGGACSIIKKKDLEDDYDLKKAVY